MAPKSAKDKAAREDAAKEAAEARYKQWKRLVPVLYDSFTNNNLVWPSLSCRLVQAACFQSEKVFLLCYVIP